MDKKLLIAILLACLIYLKINEGQKNYLCYCVIALVSVGLFTVGKSIEGFDGTDALFSGKGIKITYSGDDISGTAYTNSSKFRTLRQIYDSSDTLLTGTHGALIGEYVSDTDWTADQTAGMNSLNSSDTIYISDTITIDAPVADQTTQYTYSPTLNDLDMGYGAERYTFLDAVSLPVPSDGENYLIIKQTISTATFWGVEFYIYKVTNVDPAAAGEPVATSGTCAANTVECSATQQRNIADYASTQGSDAAACCENITGMCSENTDGTGDVACPSGSTLKSDSATTVGSDVSTCCESAPAGGGADTVTGKCSGNTMTAENFACPDGYTAKPPPAAGGGIDSPSTDDMGERTTACCDPAADGDAGGGGADTVTGKCSGNTVTDENFACPNGYTAKPPPAGGGGIDSPSTDDMDARTTACCDPNSVTCTSPADKTGYSVTAETSLVRGDSFSVTGSCDPDYIGTMLSTQCGEGGGDYSLTGCSVPTCAQSSPPCTDPCETDSDNEDTKCRKKCTSISSPSPCPGYCDSEYDEDGKCQDEGYGTYIVGFLLFLGACVALFFLWKTQTANKSRPNASLPKTDL